MARHVRPKLSCPLRTERAERSALVAGLAKQTLKPAKLHIDGTPVPWRAGRLVFASRPARRRRCARLDVFRYPAVAAGEGHTRRCRRAATSRPPCFAFHFADPEDKFYLTAHELFESRTALSLIRTGVLHIVQTGVTISQSLRPTFSDTPYLDA